MEAEIRRCQGLHSCPLARAGAEAAERSTQRVPRRTEGGNPGESSSESPESGEDGRMILACQGPRQSPADAGKGRGGLLTNG